MPEVDSVLEILRGEDAADFEWRIPGSQTKRLESDDWLQSSEFSFAGWLWWFNLEREQDPSSPVTIGLGRYRVSAAPTLEPVVRYWLGADGGPEGEEIARSTREPCSSSVQHPWLRFSELRQRLGRALTFIARFRTGPETDGEMRGLVDKEVWWTVKSSFKETADTSTQTYFETGAERNAAVAECEQSFRRLGTSYPDNAANEIPGPSGQQPSDVCVICYDEIRDCVLYPCRHLCMCHLCAVTVRNGENPVCPICRKTIRRIFKVYK